MKDIKEFLKKVYHFLRSLLVQAYHDLHSALNGETIAIYKTKVKQVPDHPMWKVETYGGPLGGLAGWAVHKGLAFYASFHTRVENHVYTDKSQPGIVFTNLMGSEESAVNNLRKLLSISGVRVELGQPQQQFLKMTPAERYAKYTYWEVVGGMPSEDKLPPYLTGEFDRENEVFNTFKLVVTREDGKDLITALQEADLFPHVGSVGPEYAGKLGKYLLHRGLPAFDASFIHFDGEFDHSGTAGAEDGQAYISLKWLPMFRNWVRDALTKGACPRITDREAITMLEKTSELIDRTPEGTPVVVKGLTTGKGMFGKGNLLFLTDEEFRDRFPKSNDVDGPAIVVDNNWIKFRAPECTVTTQTFFLHDVSKWDMKKRDIGLALIDRAFQTVKAMKALAAVYATNISNEISEVVEKGVSRFLNPDLAKEAVLKQGNGSYFIGEVKRMKETILKALLGRMCTAQVPGLNLASVAPWAPDMVGKDEVIINPCHRKMTKKALLVRYPVISPAGARWVKVTFSRVAPINGVIVHESVMHNMQADFDGDRLGLFPDSHSLIGELYESRPFNVDLPFALKGLEGEAKPTDRLQAVLRGGTAQRATGLADNALSSRIAEAVDELDGSSPVRFMMNLIYSCQDEMEVIQVLLDTIKKPGVRLKEWSYKRLSSGYLVARGKENAVVDPSEGIAHKAVAPVEAVANIAASRINECLATVSVSAEPGVLKMTPARKRKLGHLHRKLKNILRIQNTFFRVETGSWNQELVSLKPMDVWRKRKLDAVRSELGACVDNVSHLIAITRLIEDGMGRDSFMMVRELCGLFPFLKSCIRGGVRFKADLNTPRLLLPAPNGE